MMPCHVAIIMDGNGRWASRRLMPRGMGHRAGVDALVRTVQACARRGIAYLTVFAFSSENWQRPQEEVSGLMSLVLSTVGRHLEELASKGVRVRIIGDRSAVSDKVNQAWLQAEEATRHNQGLTLTVAFSYGGRWDVVQACRRALESGIRPQDLDEAAIARHLSLSYAPDPDLLIRTGGEMRISNFLLWQSAYTELYFTDCLWPDFNEVELDRALQSYARRDRRFGRVTDADAGVPKV